MYDLEHPSTSYTLAKELFEAFRGNSTVLSPEEIAASGVRSGKGARTEHIIAFGNRENDSMHQQLMLGKTGMYYFSTVFHAPYGAYRPEWISPNSERGLETLVDSLFVEAFSKVVRSRK